MLPTPTRRALGVRGIVMGATPQTVYHEVWRLPSDFAASFHGSWNLLYEGIVVIHLYQGAAHDSLKNANFLSFVLSRRSCRLF